MTECFIDYYERDYPNCRIYRGFDSDVVKMRKTMECFKSMDLRPKDIYKSPSCLTNPCPCVAECLLCRCSIGDLLDDEEVEIFEQDSNIKNNPDFVFHKGISLTSKAERYEHQKLLDKFKSDNSLDSRAKDFGMLSPSDKEFLGIQDPPSHIVKMREYIAIAETIRKIRPPVAAVPPVIHTAPADYSPQIQAATGVCVPNTTTAEQAYIDDSDGTVPNVNVVNQLSKEDVKEAVRYGIREGLLDTDALSQPARQKEIRTRQEAILLDEGRTPVEVARIHNPNASKSTTRKESLRIGNTHRQKKPRKKAK